MLKGKQILTLKRWIVLIFFSFLLLIIQSTEILTSFFNAKPNLIFSFVICSYFFLKREEALVFSVICGLFLDCFSNLFFGISSFILLIFYFLILFLIRKYVKSCFLNIFLINIFFFNLYCFLNFIIEYAFSGEKDILIIWLFNFFPNIIYTSLFSVLIFFMCKKVCYNFKMYDDSKLYKKKKEKLWAKLKKKKQKKT